MDEIQKLQIETKNLPASSSKNIRLTYSDSAKLKIIFFAPVLERYNVDDVPYDLMPKGLEIQFLDSNGEIEAHVLSNYAIHYPKQDRFELSNDVRVVHRNGDKLNSEHLVWNSRTEKILSDDFVKITTSDEIIYGDGFEANQDFTDYKISHIKGIISVEEDENENVQ